MDIGVRQNITSYRKKVKIKLYVLIFIVGALFVISIFGEKIAPNDPNKTNAMYMNAAPSALYPFGCDIYGRCILSRILAGAFTSIFSSLLLVFLSLLIGTFIGIISATKGGIVDRVLLKVSELMSSFPQMILAIAIAGLSGGGMMSAIIALLISSWPLYYRLSRGKVLDEKKNTYVVAAKLSGISDIKISFTYILPVIFDSLLVNASMQVGTAIIYLAGLSFLGIGVSAPNAEWGSMLSDGIIMISTAPWEVIFPGLMILVTVCIFNMLGDTIREYYK